MLLALEFLYIVVVIVVLAVVIVATVAACVASVMACGFCQAVVVMVTAKAQ